MMRHYYSLVFVLFLFPAMLLAADAKKEHSQADFMRVSKQEGKNLPISFDTAIAQFADEKNNIQVDLIGVIHIGDKEYYAELNEIFKKYDVVLYELVAEEGAKPNPDAGKNESQSLLSSFQSGAGSVLALEFQLAHIDYRAKNMVHADMSPADFARRFQERGDFIQMIMRIMVLSAKKSGDEEAQKEELRMLGRMSASLLFSPDPALSMKRVLVGAMMEQLEDAMWIIGGNSSAIITDRNAAALKVLRREIERGKKKIAIFYGAAHMPEFAQSLEKEFNMKQTGTEWIIAWDLTKDKSARKR